MVFSAAASSSTACASSRLRCMCRRRRFSPLSLLFSSLFWFIAGSFSRVDLSFCCLFRSNCVCDDVVLYVCASCLCVLRDGCCSTIKVSTFLRDFAVFTVQQQSGGISGCSENLQIENPASEQSFQLSLSFSTRVNRKCAGVRFYVLVSVCVCVCLGEWRMFS